MTHILFSATFSIQFSQKENYWFKHRSFSNPSSIGSKWLVPPFFFFCHTSCSSCFFFFCFWKNLYLFYKIKTPRAQNLPINNFTDIIWNFFNPNSLYDTKNSLLGYGMSGCIRILLDMFDSPWSQLTQIMFNSIHDMAKGAPVSTCCFHCIYNL